MSKLIKEYIFEVLQDEQSLFQKELEDAKKRQEEERLKKQEEEKEKEVSLEKYFSLLSKP